MHFIKSNEKREIVTRLNEQFGIEEIKHLLIQSGKDKVRAYSGHLSKDELISLGTKVNIEIVGMYLIKREEHQTDFRLSLDGTHCLHNQIKKNILIITDEEYEHWIRGESIQRHVPSGVYVIQYQTINIGCGVSNGSVIFNYVPKDRRIRK